MSEPEAPGVRHDPAREPLGVPAMPMIKPAEQYTGVPFVLVEGLTRTVGWQWLPENKGGPAFVIACLWRGHKVLERPRPRPLGHGLAKPGRCRR